ncbi:metallophosphoesterase [Bifidobacterium minimum]|uniref:Metallophosphoesterase n=2 Tax=Bifidobacterium minimum TaxID=1693 RepID=A0A087BPL9_9BIFI|nr:metallophosphoesterase [Bifidobacterium minimum]
MGAAKCLVALTVISAMAVGITVVPADNAVADEGSGSADVGSITNAMPVVITELAVKTSNGTFTDDSGATKKVNIGEFIELTNMSSSPVGIGDLSLTYNGVDWTPEAFESAASDSTKDVSIPAHKSIVIWDNYANVTHAGITPALSDDSDFNAYWKNVTGTDPGLVMGSTLFTTSKGAGMSNTSARTLSVTRRSTGATSTVSYSNGGSATDTTLVYSYSSDGTASMGTDNTATPGTTIGSQIPDSWPSIKTSPTITITDGSSVPAGTKDDAAIHLKATVTSSQGKDTIGSVRLYTKTNVDSDYVDSGFDGNNDGDVWSFTIPAGTLTGRTSLGYRFLVTASDGTVTRRDGASTIELTADQSDVKAATVPLAITELAVDTANAKGSGSDAYEFIEVTNLSGRTVDFSDNYTFYYNYPTKGDTADVEWAPKQSGITIAAHESAVFWIRNGSNDALTAGDFNSNYGLEGSDALTLGRNLFEIESAGMANNSARALKIETKTKTLVSSASYPDNASKNLTGDTHSIQYMYAGGTSESSIVRTGEDPTPGTVEDGDIRATAYEFPTNVSTPDVTDSTPTTFGTDKDLTFSFDATSTGGSITRVSLFTKATGEDGFTEHNLTKTSGSDTYSYTINKIDLLRRKSLQYYLEASDGINAVVRTDERTVSSTSYDGSPVRLNLSDGQYARGKVTVRATGTSSSDRPSLKVDGKSVDSSKITPSIESEPYIAAEVTQTDIFFLNSFTTKETISGTPSGDDWKSSVIGSFDDGTYGNTSTVSFPVSLSLLKESSDGGRTLSLYLNAGTKSSATDILDDAGTVNSENADNYLASNIRLVLSDGTHLSASKATAAVSPGDSGAVTEKDVTDEVADSSSSIKMGDTAGQYEYIRLDFEIPASSVTTNAYAWDTTALKDGTHTVTASTSEGSSTTTVTVDNTRPTITPSISSTATTGIGYRRGTITIGATASDETSGVPSSGTGALSATLANGADDATAITLPYSVSSADLPAGEHTVTFTATDEAGNTTTRTETFLTLNETPTIESMSSTAGTATNDPTLTVTAAYDGDDPLTVTFYKGSRATTATGDVTVSQGTTTQAGLVAATSGSTGTGGTALGDSDARKLAKSDDGATVTTTGTDDGFPYQSFTVTVPDSVSSDADASTALRWKGSAEAGSDIYAYVKNTSTNVWDQVARVTADDDGDASIDVTVALANHLSDGKMTVVVQNGTGYSSGDLTDGASDASASSTFPDYAASSTASTIDGADGKAVVTMDDDAISQEDTPRSDYDFTFAWESDTQYYNANYENDGYYQHQENIHNWLIRNRSAMNIQYLFHTGDIVDNAQESDQWERADAQYAKLDEAHFPYGVLAGNHDVSHKEEDYTSFSTYFGESRYSSNPWYGGSYENNRGHYDLISAGGLDFVVVSMGWGIDDSEIDWMNQVLKKYSNRIAILDFHEYLLASGGLGLVPQEVYKRVVVPNANVKMVLSGHYHSAQKTVSKIDTDGDGVADRNVVNLLFDYQAMTEGGMGFIRLMHINTANATMQVRTYSPSLDKYGSQTVESSDFTPSDEEFTIDLTQLGITPVTSSGRQKTLTTDSFDTDLRGGKASVIGTVTVKATKARALASSRSLLAAASATSATRTATLTWKNAPTGTQGWYAVVKGEYAESSDDSADGSGVVVSPVSTVTVASRQTSDGSTGTDTDTDTDNGAGTGNGGSGTSDGDSWTGSNGSSNPGSGSPSQTSSSSAQSDGTADTALSATGTTVTSIVATTVLTVLAGAILRSVSRRSSSRRRH